MNEDPLISSFFTQFRNVQGQWFGSPESLQDWVNRKTGKKIWHQRMHTYVHTYARTSGVLYVYLCASVLEYNFKTTSLKVNSHLVTSFQCSCRGGGGRGVYSIFFVVFCFLLFVCFFLVSALAVNNFTDIQKLRTENETNIYRERIVSIYT